MKPETASISPWSKESTEGGKGKRERGKERATSNTDRVAGVGGVAATLGFLQETSAFVERKYRLFFYLKRGRVYI